MLNTQPQRSEWQFDFAQLQAIVEQTQMQQNPLAAVLAGIGKGIAVGVLLGVGAAALGSVFGEDDTARDEARRRRARNRGLNGPRVKLSIEKTGTCTCCSRQSRYTEVHHYAGRAVPRGREMCAPCHFHCGHNGHWNNDAVNPRSCRLAA